MGYDVRLSKRLSYVLRHRPDTAGLTLGPGGWVAVDDVLTALDISRDRLDAVVRDCDKQRFALDGDLIRAQQGHSVEVDLALDPADPPAVLWHGTPERFVEAILREGLRPQRRHAVHLSPDRETAVRVGERRGRAVVLEVDAAAMAASGHEFTVSGNGVWLVDRVPPQFITVLDRA